MSHVVCAAHKGQRPSNAKVQYAFAQLSLFGFSALFCIAQNAFFCSSQSGREPLHEVLQVSERQV